MIKRIFLFRQDLGTVLTCQGSNNNISGMQEKTLLHLLQTLIKDSSNFAKNVKIIT